MVAAVPVPVKDSTAGEFDASPAKDSVPVAVPELLGVNFTVKDAVLPAAMVTGNDIPLTLNSELVVVAPATTMLDPEAVSVAAIVLLDPTATLPRVAVVGETASVPVASPVPDKGTVSVLVAALEVRTKLPVSVPAAVGSNLTVKVTLCDASRVKGTVMPVSLNPVPLVLAEEMVTAALPTLLTVSVTLLALPDFTVPKFTLVRLAERLPVAVVPPLPVVLPTLLPFAAIPPPFNCSIRLESAALLAKVTVAQSHCAVVGVKRIETAALLPDASVRGNVGERI